jgi:hypothetical protein
MNNAIDWEELSLEASQDRRRERRIPLAFPVEVSGFDQNGRYFSEQTMTTDISESGCRFYLKIRVDRGAMVALKVVSRGGSKALPDRPLLFQVARVTQEGDGWVVGAVKLQPESLWCVAFPIVERRPTTFS